MVGQTPVNLCTPPTLMWRLLPEQPNNQEQLTIQPRCREGLNAGILSRLIPKSIYVMIFFFGGGRESMVRKRRSIIKKGSRSLQLGRLATLL